MTQPTHGPAGELINRTPVDTGPSNGSNRSQVSAALLTMRILVTGSSGYIASLLLPKLLDHPDVEMVVGVDRKPPRIEHPKLQVILDDILNPLDDDLHRWQIDTVVHLAFVLSPSRWRRSRARRVNIRGARRVLEACQAAKVKHVVWFSSTAAYGAYPDNPSTLSEDTPLQPNVRFPYSHHKAESDSMARRFLERSPGTSLTLLRGCPVVGPNGGSAVQGWFSKPFFPRIPGFDPQMQFIHEEDLAEILARCIIEQIPGVYNVTGDGTVALSQVAYVLKKRLVPIPAWLLYPITSFLWGVGLSNIADAPGAGIDFIRYPWVASNDRIKEALGVASFRTSRQALEAYRSNSGKA